MKKALTRGEKLLFVAPLILLAVAGFAWMRQKTAPYSIEVPKWHVVSSLEFSPDGKRLLAFFGSNSTSEMLGQVVNLAGRSKVYDLEMPKMTPYFERRDIIGAPSWSNDGKRIVASYQIMRPPQPVNKILIWDATNGTKKVEFNYSAGDKRSTFGPLRYSPDDKTLIGGGIPPARFDANDGKPLNQLDETIKQDQTFARLSENGQWLALRDPMKPLFQVLDFKTKRVIWKPAIGYLSAFDWGGDILCVQNDAISVNRIQQGENRLILWNGKTRQLLPSPPIRSGAEIIGFSFSPDHKTLVYYDGKLNLVRGKRTTGESLNDYDGELVAWDVAAHRVLWRYATSELILWPRWSPDGKRLAVFSRVEDRSHRLRIFDKSGKIQYEREPVGPLVKWSPDSTQLAINVTETRKWGTKRSSRIEIHRFAD